MAHAEKCPVCNGAGKVYHFPDPNITITVKEEVCNGCGGKGWVEVNDSGDYTHLYTSPDSDIPIKFSKININSQVVYHPF